VKQRCIYLNVDKFVVLVLLSLIKLMISVSGLLSMLTSFTRSAGQQTFVVGRDGFLSKQVQTVNEVVLLL